MLGWAGSIHPKLKAILVPFLLKSNRLWTKTNKPPKKFLHLKNLYVGLCSCLLLSPRVSVGAMSLGSSPVVFVKVSQVPHALSPLSPVLESFVSSLLYTTFWLSSWNISGAPWTPFCSVTKTVCSMFLNLGKMFPLTFFLSDLLYFLNALSPVPLPVSLLLFPLSFSPKVRAVGRLISHILLMKMFPFYLSLRFLSSVCLERGIFLTEMAFMLRSRSSNKFLLN